MRGYLFHGLRVVSRGEVDPDPVEALLGPLRAGSFSGAPDLVVDLAPAAALPADGTGPVLFRHGALAVRRDLDALLVTSPLGALRVSADGSRIAGDVRPLSTPEALDAFAGTHLLVAIVLALLPRRCFHLHAATTVSTSGEAVVVAGTGGAGKSTLAVALVASGHAYLGDDVVFVEQGPAGPRLLALPRPFHLTVDSAGAHPAALAQLDRGRRTSAGKHVLDPGAAFPGGARAEAPAPAVLLFPEVAHVDRTEVEPLAPADALGTLLACSMFAFTPLGSAAQRETLAAVASAARSFRVRLGRDLLDDPAGTAQRLRVDAGL